MQIRLLCRTLYRFSRQTATLCIVQLSLLLHLLVLVFGGWICNMRNNEVFASRGIKREKMFLAAVAAAVKNFTLMNV